MPEGPEVHTIADWLQQEIIGARLLDLAYSTKSRYNKKPLSGLSQLKDLLPSLTITDVGAKGKKIIFMLENDNPDIHIFLISSLMMEGKWTWEEGKHSDLWLDLETKQDQKKRLYFDDSRHFGIMEVVLSEKDLLKRLDEVGPDLITDEITDEAWLAKIRNKRIKNKKIGLFLMEQKYFSGIGNYLRAEILYDAKISPHRQLNSLSDAEALTIFDSARNLIMESYQAQGATLATYRNPHGGKGDFQVVVYGKKIDPLGNPVVAEDIGDKRMTHWVPSVQV